MNVDLGRRLHRARQHRLIAGGIAEYVEIDPTLARVLVALILLLTTGQFAILVDVLRTFLIPLGLEADRAGWA